MAAAFPPFASPPRYAWRRLLLLWFLLSIGFAVDTTVRAQSATTNATTDSSDARALNTVFERWGISATDNWNISGELCSGAAVNTTPIDWVNPGIKCRCNFNNRTTCRITALRIYQLNVIGPIPDDLWNLSMLDELTLERNYLTGPLSPSVGRLTRMKYLNLRTNALSGEVPKELGMLTDLIYLAFGTNNFSGSLPPELGSLSRLTQLFFDSAGVSGPIPQTFANLRSLQILLASDNALTGPIPDFIGNWSSLRQLRFQGNSFQGPIPQSFSNLTSMEDLRISDISSNGSSSLDFLRNMNLSSLDLSFNNLRGGIPESLFNLSSLQYLFLGKNKFSGPLPNLKNSNLKNIDLSYNELSGSIPNWFGENLQINLVSNNFTSDNLGDSSGLYCLQRNFPCSQGQPVYSSFAVSCGGPRILYSDQVYEEDTENLGPATYSISESGRWAVSNIGFPADGSNPAYKISVMSNFANTSDSRLFQTARASAGSLRYYGLRMENGNYTVTLQFVESVIVGAQTWESVGRRVFDIYVQGNLVKPDFDITRVAGASLTAVVRQFTIEVLENHIDIHLFWAGKGTCCVPYTGAYGPLISAISATRNNPPTNRTGLIVGIVVGVVAASLLCLFAVRFVLQQRKKQKKIEEEEFLGIDTRPYMFSYTELIAATDDFDHSNKLGEGGFGPVYKGALGDGRAVAVKQLSVASRQGKSQFVAEIAAISAVRHRNLVRLYGCCIDKDERLIVYEYLENQSLDKILFGTSSKPLSLDWPMRYEICLGVARGLAYLHEESHVRIVHRDVKASNILLDSNLTPKISDFGLAKLYDDTKTHISTQVVGTIFGVVALEIISGRPNADSSLQDDMVYLLEWAWNLHESNKDIDLVDSTLLEYNPDEVTRIIRVALLCTQASPTLRPSMSRAVAMLSGDIEVASVTTRPSYLTDWGFNDVSAFSFPNTDGSSTSNTHSSHKSISQGNTSSSFPR